MRSLCTGRSPTATGSPQLVATTSTVDVLGRPRGETAKSAPTCPGAPETGPATPRRRPGSGAGTARARPRAGGSARDRVSRKAGGTTPGGTGRIGRRDHDGDLSALRHGDGVDTGGDALVRGLRVEPGRLRSRASGARVRLGVGRSAHPPDRDPAEPSAVRHPRRPPVGAGRTGAGRDGDGDRRLLLVVGVLALAGLGCWLLFAYPFPNVAVVFGVALVGLAVVLRPRVGRLDADLEVLDPRRAPELHALVAEVAAAVGAPVPQVIGVDGSFNAYSTSVGLRRQRVLCLGLPLWGALDGAQRVALIGHELAHFVNGDVRRLLVTQPALTMLGNAADLFRPSPPAGPAGCWRWSARRWAGRSRGCCPGCSSAFTCCWSGRRCGTASGPSTWPTSWPPGRRAAPARATCSTSCSAGTRSPWWCGRRPGAGRDHDSGGPRPGAGPDGGGRANAAGPPVVGPGTRVALRLAPAGRTAPPDAHRPRPARADGDAGREPDGAPRRGVGPALRPGGPDRRLVRRAVDGARGRLPVRTRDTATSGSGTSAPPPSRNRSSSPRG